MRRTFSLSVIAAFLLAAGTVEAGQTFSGWTVVRPAVTNMTSASGAYTERGAPSLRRMGWILWTSREARIKPRVFNRS